MRIWENLKLDPPSGADGTGVFGSGITVRGNFLLLQVFTFAFSYASVIDDQHGFYGWDQISWVSSYIELSFQTDAPFLDASCSKSFTGPLNDLDDYDQSILW